MSEETRNEVVRRFFSGASIRKVARELGISRNRVRRVLREHAQQRATGVVPTELQPKATRPSLLDSYQEKIDQLLERWTAIVAMYEEAKSRASAQAQASLAALRALLA